MLAGVAEALNGKAQHPHPTLPRLVDLGDAAEVLDLRVLEHLVELVDRPHRHLGLPEALHPVGRGGRAELLLHPSLELGVVGEPVVVGGELGMGRELGITEPRTKAAELLGPGEHNVDVAVLASGTLRRE